MDRRRMRVSVCFVVTIFIVGTADCRPSSDFHNEDSLLGRPALLDDDDWLNLNRYRRVVYPAGFQFMYVGQDGRIVEHNKPQTGSWIEFVGSPEATHQAIYTAALIVSRMLRHSPSHIFTTLAQRAGAGVGIYTKAEKLTIFPENQRYADTPHCAGRCDNDCSITCTFDGRKYEALGGLTTSRSMVLQDNVLCSSQDPHQHHNNIVVHEFAHSIQNFGLNSTEKNQVIAAYDNAKAHHLWTTTSYAMANAREYFAEGTGAFFLVNMERSTIGGMIDCQGHVCLTEAEARANLMRHDPMLYHVLSHVYTDGHPNTASGLSVCPTSTSG